MSLLRHARCDLGQVLTSGGLSSLSVKSKDDLAKLWQGIKARPVNLKPWEPTEH